MTDPRKQFRQPSDYLHAVLLVVAIVVALVLATVAVWQL